MVEGEGVGEEWVRVRVRGKVRVGDALGLDLLVDEELDQLAPLLDKLVFRDGQRVVVVDKRNELIAEVDLHAAEEHLQAYALACRNCVCVCVCLRRRCHSSCR